MSETIFLVAPGASGKDPIELRTMLSTLGATYMVCDKWKSKHPSGMKKNTRLLKERIIERNHDFPHHKIVLVGHSFGCRVIVALFTEMISTPSSSLSLPSTSSSSDKDKRQCKPKKRKANEEEEELQLPNSILRHCAILESYPLYGPSRPKNVGTDRVLPLENLLAINSSKLDTTGFIPFRLLFVSGEKDEFLDRRHWRPSDATIGCSALEEIVYNDDYNKKIATQNIRNTCIIHRIKNAKHGVFQVKKSEQSTVEKQFLHAAKEFLEDSNHSDVILERELRSKRKVRKITP